MAIGESVSKKQAKCHLRIKFLLLGILFLTVMPAAKSQNLESIRKSYYNATTDGKEAAKLYTILDRLNSSDAVMMAYYGSAQALKAKYSWNPYIKLSYLVEGQKTLKQAVIKSPDNLEIRFLRFCLEHYIPAFLGMSNNLESDRRKIVQLIKRNQYGSIDEALLKDLFSFLKRTNRCTPEELRVLAKAGS